jgi:hypothetical protein
VVRLMHKAPRGHRDNVRFEPSREPLPKTTEGGEPSGLRGSCSEAKLCGLVHIWYMRALEAPRPENAEGPETQCFRAF